MHYRIEQDTAAENPRTAWSHMGTMLCFHSRYHLGDKHVYANEDEAVISIASVMNENFAEWVCSTHSPDDIQVEQACNIVMKHAVTLPLYLYEYSGITMRTGPFSCSWNSGRVGLIYMTNEDMRKQFSKEKYTDDEAAVSKAQTCLEAEVAEYDQYLTGDVWGVIVEDDEGNEVDSCWGMFGYEYAEAEAKAMLKACEEVAAERAKKEAEATLKEEVEYWYWASRDVMTVAD